MINTRQPRLKLDVDRLASTNMESDFKFTRSLVMMGRLAQSTARTPPAEDNPLFEYVDRSLTILGRTLDTYDQKIQEEFLAQRQFIATKIRDVRAQLDERFQKVDRCFDRQKDEIQDVRAQMEDFRFQMANGGFLTLNGGFLTPNGGFSTPNG